MIKEYVKQAVAAPLRQVAGEMAMIYTFAAIGIAVGLVTTAMLVVRRCSEEGLKARDKLNHHNIW